jgi:hypothetical protein
MHYQGERNDFLFRRACAWRRRGAQLDEIERRLLADYVLRHIICILFRCSFCGRGSTEPHCSRRCDQNTSPTPVLCHTAHSTTRLGNRGFITFPRPFGRFARPNE